MKAGLLLVCLSAVLLLVQAIPPQTTKATGLDKPKDAPPGQVKKSPNASTNNATKIATTNKGRNVTGDQARAQPTTNKPTNFTTKPPTPGQAKRVTAQGKSEGINQKSAGLGGNQTVPGRGNALGHAKNLSKPESKKNTTATPAPAAQSNEVPTTISQTTTETPVTTANTEASTSVTEASNSVTEASTTVTEASTTVTEASTSVTEASTTVTEASTTVTDAVTSVTEASTTVTDSPTSVSQTTTEALLTTENTETPLTA